MADLLTPDICVIGGGAAGLSVAAAGAALGVSVVLIEQGAMGGECLNTGCVPSKALIGAARAAWSARHAGRFGINARPKVAFESVCSQIKETVAEIAPMDSAERFRAMGVQVIEGWARFADRRTVVVDGRRIRARRFVIATGAGPKVPAIPGLRSVAFHTNETIFSLAERPKHLAVLGGGPVGLELAQAFSRLGSKVTVIEAASPLGGEDPELAAIVLDGLAGDGVRLRRGVRVERVTAAEDGVRLALDDGSTVAASELLVAVGRRPRTRKLGLTDAGIHFDPTGIVVDERLRTTNRRVYAIGDVIDAPRFTHAASYEAGIVLRNALFRWRARASYHHVPRVTYTVPELAQVGLTEAEAAALHGRIRVLRWPFADNDRARIERETAGHIKLIATAQGRVLGVGIVGAQAGELIQVWSLAVAGRLSLRDMAELVPAYPSLGEISRRAAVEFYKPRLTRPLVRRIIAAMRVFG